MVGVVSLLSLILYGRGSPPNRLTVALNKSDVRATEAWFSLVPHAPFRAPLASDSDDMRRLKLSATAMRNDATATPRERALAQLLLGAPAAATASLQLAANNRSEDATYWCDYAALLYEEGRATGHRKRFAQALAAADRSLQIDNSHSPAVFNRALALKALGLDRFARDAYEHYLNIDKLSPWAREVRTRLRPLQRPTKHELWKHALQDATVANQSTPELAALAAKFPQQTRTWAEGILLTSWAESVTSDPPMAKEIMANARAVATALKDQSGERFLSDTLDHIEAIRAPERDQLVRAMAIYKEGRILFSRQQATDALSRFEASADTFRAIHSPMALIAAYYEASAKFETNRVEEAGRDLEKLDALLPSTYVALRAQVAWELGSTYANSRRLAEAIDSYTKAATLFAALRESEFHARMRHIQARLLTLVGRDEEAWDVRGQAFLSVASAGDQVLLEFGVGEAAQDALLQGDWDIARSFFDLTLSIAASPRRVVDAHVWRSLSWWRTGDPHQAEAELQRARNSLMKIPDPALRQAAEQEVAFVHALLTGKRAPLQAIELLDGAIDFSRRHGRLNGAPAMLLERARLHRATGSNDVAIKDLSEGIEILEKSARAFQTDDVRDSFFGTTNALYQDLFDLYVDVGCADCAFRTAERRRARALYHRLALNSPAPLVSTLREVMTTVHDGETLLHYTVNPNRIVLFVITASDYRMHQLKISPGPLSDDIAAFRSSIIRNQRHIYDVLGRRLYEQLIAPAGTEALRARLLILVPDPALEDVPFAALRDPESTRYLIEKSAFVVAPSASIFRGLTTRRHDRGRTQNALVVADPAFDRTRFGSFADLPVAEKEGREVAAMYPRSKLLTGRDATARQILAAMQESALLHVAAHTLLDERDPSRSAILLAPSDGEVGTLSLRQIATTDLRNTNLVVLAGCRTASRGSRTRDISSLAVAFLAAGAHEVVGTIWNVEDAPTREIGRRLHHYLLSGESPAEAVRAAQIEMLRSSAPELNTPSAWAGVQAYGSN